MPLQSKMIRAMNREVDGPWKQDCEAASGDQARRLYLRWRRNRAVTEGRRQQCVAAGAET